MASENRSKALQIGLVLGAGTLLEACYLGMHHLYYLKNHAIAFIELGLAAGIVYLIALYGFGQTRGNAHSIYFTHFRRDCIPRNTLADGTDALR